MRRRVGLAALALSATLVLALASWHWLPGYGADPFSAAQAIPLRIVDRDGELLRALPAPGSHPGRGRWVSLSDVAPEAIAALLASEDQHFFEHSGVDVLAVGRAVWLDVKSGALRYGASTLSMQLARMLASAGRPRSLWNKLREVVIARRLERTWDKHTLLEQYLNRAYFGHGAYGIEAAAERYFDKPARSLSAGEASLLVVLVRGPAVYDLKRHRKRALARRDHLFELLVEQGRLSADQRERAEAQPIVLTERPPTFRAPHFVDWLLTELPEAVTASGGTLVSTLDLKLQQALEHRTRAHVQSLSRMGVEQAGVVVLDTQTGDVLAMVGSADYAQQPLNITTRRRHPGSTLKPFVYATALAHGAHPGSVAYDVHDVPSDYVTRGTAGQEYGPVRYRQALAGSLNLAAVHTLEHVGPGPVLSVLRKAGLGPLDGSATDYGLRLALGAPKLRLLDLAAAYGVWTRKGEAVRPRGWRVLRDRANRLVERAPAGLPQPVFSPQVAWLVADMLADPEARRFRFGPDLPVDLPHPVVAKTGTARGFADAYMLLTTREVTVGAWTGRFDGGPTKGLSGMRGAGPLARAALRLALGDRAWSLPARPEGLARVPLCPLSGRRPGQHCPHTKLEWAEPAHVPAQRCSWHRADGVHYPPELTGWAHRQVLAGHAQPRAAH